jgi:hypothetical protein
MKKTNVPPLIAGYITLGVIGGGAFISLYGILLTFLVQTMRDPTTVPLTPEETQQKKLKQTMIGLSVIIGLVGIIFGIITAAKTKGPLRTGIFMALFAAISVFFLISTSITYTQDSRITGKFDDKAGAASKKVKTGVEIGLIVSALATAGFGGGTVAVIYKNWDVIKAVGANGAAFAKTASKNPEVQKYVVQGRGGQAGGGQAGGKAAQHAAKKAAHEAQKAADHAKKQALRTAAKQSAKHNQQVKSAATAGAAAPTPPAPV